MAPKLSASQAAQEYVERKQNQPKGGKKRSGRIKAFFKGVWSELKKVHWPSKKQLVKYTGVVIFVVLVMSIAISAFDWVISTPINWLLSK